ncbi:EscU/YscU/HrcU family type III secretion system export apparatus switch protein [Methylococcus sp. EFPC2]|uniref:EscU/YscU/HrcU family type III secretion system export apparatus switch protein n=1 Tax=Methylococcus sp. EFPC2 TaxID=2812648 RepID=UPI001967EA4B|nr:EscU/YscU/HrcU family type III secretion system export apparatus switch protein [Methylococcus sp. EFPC2]QSA98834.1 EscU/YscU/HrcU family type III secretion system export apparatus switch protein [Methylococcus sp. EFPC2]
MNKVINPPDIAVALHYDGTHAPRVTAKGTGDVAEQIIRLAREHAIPLHPDPALIKVLANVPLGDEIPRELYLAVAEVIAFAYLLSGKHPED